MNSEAKKRYSENWIGVDWGSTNFRWWVVGKSGDIIHFGSSEAGIKNIASKKFESVLISEINKFLEKDRTVKVFCCGMIGGRQGWRETKYLDVPCKPPNFLAANFVKTDDSRIEVFILPGIRQKSPEDVMRGEEIQIAGILDLLPDFDGVICLPGTHTKWVSISAGEIICFRTFMTGEVFSLLGEQSVLQHSIDHKSWDDTSFLFAVGESFSDSKLILSRLFHLRARSLFDEDLMKQTRSRLSGLLIGSELSGARVFWLGQNIMISGN